MADGADFIIERYTDKVRGYNPHTKSNDWYRIRQWVGSDRRYKNHDGFANESIVRYYLSRHLDIEDQSQVGFVDLTLEF